MNIKLIRTDIQEETNLRLPEELCTRYRELLPSGNLSCWHPCRSHGRCRHSCCHNGVSPRSRAITGNVQRSKSSRRPTIIAPPASTVPSPTAGCPATSRDFHMGQGRDVPLARPAEEIHPRSPTRQSRGRRRSSNSNLNVSVGTNVPVTIALFSAWLVSQQNRCQRDRSKQSSGNTTSWYEAAGNVLGFCSKAIAAWDNVKRVLPRSFQGSAR